MTDKALVYIAVSDGKFFVNAKPKGFMPQYVAGPLDTVEEAQAVLAEFRETPPTSVAAQGDGQSSLSQSTETSP